MTNKIADRPFVQSPVKSAQTAHQPATSDAGDQLQAPKAAQRHGQGTPAPVASAVAKPQVLGKPDKTAAQKLPTLALSDAERMNQTGVQAQDANQRGTRTAEIHPGVLSEATNGSKLSTYTMSVGLGPSADTPVLNVDRQGPVVAETMTVDHHLLAPYAGMMGGCYMLGMNVGETANITTNALILATPDFAAPVLIQRFHVGEASLSVGAAAIVAGGSGIKVLASKEGWVQLEQKQKLSVGGLLLAGVSNGFIGVSGRLTVMRERELLLKRWVKPHDAASIMKAQDKGLKGYARNKAIALGMKKPMMSFPDVSSPTSLEMRDEVVCSVRGNMTGTIALASTVVLTGINLNLNGEFELAVGRRKDETTDHKDALVVAVSPKKVSKSVSAFIDLAVLGEVRSTVSKANVTRQSYQFDMDEPEAMEAYQGLLRGDLPGAALELTHVDALDASRFVGLLGEEKLPKGVRRIFAERAEIPLAAAHVGGFTLPRYIPYFKWAGLSAEVRTQHARHMIADADSAASQDTHTRTVEKQKLRYGTETTKSFTRTQSLVRQKESQGAVQAVTLGAQMTLDRSLNKNRNVLTEQLNKHLLVKPVAKPFVNTDVKFEQTYDLSAEREIGQDELARLVNMAAKQAVPTQSPEPLRHLLTGLGELGDRATKQPENTTPLFGAYVRSTGLKGVGALHRLLGDDSKLTIKPKSSAQGDVNKKKLELVTKYDRPIEARITSRSRLNKRVLQVHEAVKEAVQAADDLRQDPLLKTFAPETLESDLKSIENDKHAMKKLIDTEHLDTMSRGILKRRLSQDANKILEATERSEKKAK